MAQLWRPTSLERLRSRVVSGEGCVAPGQWAQDAPASRHVGASRHGEHALICWAPRRCTAGRRPSPAG